MKDIYGFEVCPNDFSVVSDNGQEFVEYRVYQISSEHIIADRYSKTQLVRQFVPTWRQFIKVTSPTVEERLKEKFWKFEDKKPWE